MRGLCDVNKDVSGAYVVLRATPHSRTECPFRALVGIERSGSRQNWNERAIKLPEGEAFHLVYSKGPRRRHRLITPKRSASGSPAYASTEVGWFSHQLSKGSHDS